MISVRKMEVLSSGLNGLTCIATGIIGLLTTNSIIPTILLIIIVFGNLGKTFILKKCKTEVWDELASQNYAQASKITLLYIQLMILVLAIICIIWSVDVILNDSILIILAGSIDILKVCVFLHKEMKITE